LAIHAPNASFVVVGSQPPVAGPARDDGSTAAPTDAAAKPLLVARGLCKSFSGTPVVRGLDVTVHERECLGVLGPNGAGKTTTIRMISCQSPIGGGEVVVFGRRVEPRSERAIKAQIGIVPQEDNLDPDLSVLSNLLVYASYFGIPRRTASQRADELLALFALDERAASRIDTLSGGMKRRLTIARALINAPALLVLDEPTTGLDPQARHLVWAKLRELLRRGTTMLLTTHYMEEAAQLCDRIVIMDDGRSIAEGSPRELIRAYAGREVVEVFGPPPGLAERCAALASRIEATPDALRLYLDDGKPLGSLLAALGDLPFLHRAANLEDVFLFLTKRELRD
jgi:lipooligosaccharide transport system ATP-binding protein